LIGFRTFPEINLNFLAYLRSSCTKSRAKICKYVLHWYLCTDTWLWGSSWRDGEKEAWGTLAVTLLHWYKVILSLPAFSSPTLPLPHWQEFQELYFLKSTGREIFQRRSYTIHTKA
jgi:hypothetical protein